MEIPPAYLDRIRVDYPDLSAVKLAVNSDGLVNDIVIVQDELIFRFPKDDWARQALVREARILNLVSNFIDTEVPVIERLELDFATYRLIPGRALHRNEILRQPHAVQDRFAEQLANFLRQLHTIPSQALSDHDIPASDAVRTREDWIHLFQTAERELFPLLMTHSREWLIDLFTPLLKGHLDMSYQPVLTHGDLGPYHVLIDPTLYTLNGVIDFGTSGLGDPADDFAAVINSLGESFLQRMLPFYPQIEDALDRARFWAGTLEVQWAIQGLRTKDLSWFVCHLGRAQDVMPVGLHSFVS